MSHSRRVTSSVSLVLGGRMGRTVVAAGLLLVGLALGACGGGSSGDSVAHPTGDSEIVLQISTGGGFVPVEYNLTLLPEFTLYGDGRVVVTGPMIEIYPGPALPNLQTTVITEDVVQAILVAAREAGLFDPSFDYGQPGITDVGTTTVLVNADGVTYRSQIYALGFEEGVGGLSLEQQQARAAVNDLRGKLTDLTVFTSDEVAWKPYDYKAMAVFSQAVDPAAAPDPTEVQPNHLDWPLGDLATLGREVEPVGFRRVVISGDDLTALQPLLLQATQITLWKSGGVDYRLSFRPLLPDEVDAEQ